MRGWQSRPRRLRRRKCEAATAQFCKDATKALDRMVRAKLRVFAVDEAGFKQEIPKLLTAFKKFIASEVADFLHKPPSNVSSLPMSDTESARKKTNRTKLASRLGLTDGSLMKPWQKHSRGLGSLHSDSQASWRNSSMRRQSRATGRCRSKGCRRGSRTDA